MKKALSIVAWIVFLLAACNSPGQTGIPETLPTSKTNTPPLSPCGDGVCNEPENASNCPQDCGDDSVNTPGATSELQPAGANNTYWVTNPTSDARLYVQAFYPNDWDGQSLVPTLVLMPGGIAKSDPGKAAGLARQGFLVIVFDADGRGQSEGTEDYNGFITQDGLAAVIEAALQLPGMDESRYGLVSYSYGVTAATGALARYPDLPIEFYIDWEGPVDRNYTTVGCGNDPHGDISWQPCSDNSWWAEREAINFIADVNVPYQRIQSEEDHVQPNNDHAIDIVNAAVAGGAPWVRLNDYPPNQTYDKNNPPAMIPESEDRKLDARVAEYVKYIITNILPVIP